jgi:undecaprenyl-diphosphatase
MPILPIIILGLIQGITEFLPISSSAHLIIAPYLFNFENQSLVIDICLHIGTLLAVIFYFKKEVFDYFITIPKLFSSENSQETRNLKNLIIATIPIVLAGGLIFILDLTHLLRNLQVIGLATIFFGILLYFADIKSDQTNNLSSIGFKQVFIIGCSQILAIIPGTSRAGIIYTTSRFYKISRVEATKFSMLLSIPTILISSFIPLIEIFNKKDVAFTGDAIAAVLVAFITAMFAIKFLIKWVSSHTMLPFVIYRIVLGSVMLIVAV